jgi:hypothetical protein
LRDRQVEGSLEFLLYQILHDIEPHQRRTIAHELAQAAVGNLGSDENLKTLISAADTAFEPLDERPWLATLRGKTADLTAFPETAGYLREIEIERAMTENRAIVWDTELDQATSSRMNYFKLLRHIDLLQREDRAGAVRELGRLSSAELTESRGLPVRLRLARLAGLKDELAVLEKAARRQLYVETLLSWQVPEEYSGARIYLVFALSEALEDKPMYPQAWLDGWLESCRQEEIVTFIRLRDAELRRDWSKAQSHAARLLEFDPSDHSVQLSLGRAAKNLGDRQTARTALAKAVAFGYNLPERNQAKAWLAELGGAP